jgi:hypothetical protein
MPDTATYLLLLVDVAADTVSTSDKDVCVAVAGPLWTNVHVDDVGTWFHTNVDPSVTVKLSGADDVPTVPSAYQNDTLYCVPTAALPKLRLTDCVVYVCVITSAYVKPSPVGAAAVSVDGIALNTTVLPLLQLAGSTIDTGAPPYDGAYTYQSPMRAPGKYAVWYVHGAVPCMDDGAEMPSKVAYLAGPTSMIALMAHPRALASPPINVNTTVNDVVVATAACVDSSVHTPPALVGTAFQTVTPPMVTVMLVNGRVLEVDL